MACAKYGWTLHYVLWEVSYVNLNMMLTDAITIDYDSKSNDIINADDPANAEQLRRELYE